jgi:hypothetical protein
VSSLATPRALGGEYAPSLAVRVVVRPLKFGARPHFKGRGSMSSCAPTAVEGTMRRRRLSGRGVRPLNFTVRRHAQLLPERR